MSQFFGCIAFSPATDLAPIARRMENGMAFFQPNATGVYQTDTVFICNKLLHTSPESASTTGIYENERFVLAASCRLDNRDELAQKLQLAPDRSDHDYLLTAYTNYGSDCLSFLLGDFSFVVWDKREQRLFMAKDQLGIRPLFYLKNESLFIFSTSISGIKAAFDRPLPLNKLYIAYELKTYDVPVELTFFEDIHRLKPAHYAYFGPESGLTPEQRYWELQPMDLSHLTTDEARLAELRRLFTQAVARRLHTTRNVGCQLSGGMDSSAIGVLASRLMDKKRLHTFSFVLNEKTRAYSAAGIDERGTQEDIIRYAGLVEQQHHFIEEFHYADVFEELQRTNLIMGGHANADCMWQETLFREAQQQNVGVMLSGFPGDECVSNNGDLYYHDYIYAKDWRSLERFIKTYKLQSLKRIAGYYRAKYNGTYLRSYAAIQKERNLLRADSPFHEVVKDTTFKFYPSYKEYLKNSICRGHTCLRTESEGAYALAYGIDMVYPMADLQLIQFVYSLPSDMFRPIPLQRMLFRNLCEGVLPDSVRLQPKFNGAMTLAFAEYWLKKSVDELEAYELKNTLKMFNERRDQDKEDTLVFNPVLRAKKMDYLIELNLNRPVG